MVTVGRHLGRGRTLASYGSNASPTYRYRSHLLFNSISLRFFLVYDHNPLDRQIALAGLTDLLADRRLSHTIGVRFGLDDIAAAHEAVEQGKIVGNVILELP